jgi:uncharacterized membrane protein
MKHKQFIIEVNASEVVERIRVAEASTSGEIRVFISRKEAPDPVAVAQAKFEHLGMCRTRHHNGVLIFVAPRSNTFAIVGDVAVHEICGQGFWEDVRNQMQDHYRGGRYTQGLVMAIDHAGELLAKHFPREKDNPNELPDEIVMD